MIQFYTHLFKDLKDLSPMLYQGSKNKVEWHRQYMEVAECSISRKEGRKKDRKERKGKRRERYEGMDEKKETKEKG